MAVIGTSMISGTRFSMQYTWRMETMHTYYACQNFKMLHTSRFLMDEKSGQFYAIYGNTYQKMSTKPMLEEKWGQGELIDQLAATRQAFDYAGLSGSTPCLQHSSPANIGQDDFILERPAPKTVQYQLPSFSLDRPTARLTIEERVQVHHNYISAVSNLEHKKDLINRLKRSNPQNIYAYEAEMWRHMALHDNVLEGYSHPKTG